MNLDLLSLVHEFQAEATEHLDALNAQLLKLERDPAAPTQPCSVSESIDQQTASASISFWISEFTGVERSRFHARNRRSSARRPKVRAGAHFRPALNGPLTKRQVGRHCLVSRPVHVFRCR